MTARFLTITTFAGLLVIAGCGGGGTPPLSSTSTTPTSKGDPQLHALSSTFEWGSRALQGAKYIGPAKFTRLALHVVVRERDEAGLIAYAKAVSNPASPLYRKYLTPSEIADRFASSAADYRTAAQYFVQQGLSVGGWPQRMVLNVAGSQRALERAFATQFGVYQRGHDRFVAPMKAPKLEVGNLISRATGLVTSQRRHTNLARPPAIYGLGLGPQQIASAFDFTGAYAAGLTGSNITVGIIGTGLINSVDVPNYGHLFGVPAAPIHTVAALPQAPSSINNQTGTGLFDPNPGGLAPPPQANLPVCTTSSGAPPPADQVVDGCATEDAEAQLDTEQVATLAPAATVNFYLAYNTADCGALPTNLQDPGCQGVYGLYLADDEIQQAIADNKADVLSLSYGEDEYAAYTAGVITPDQGGPGPSEFAALAAEGIAVFVSSGDSGVGRCTDVSPDGSQVQIVDAPCASYPASDPSVVAVGGTNTPINADGSLASVMTAWGSVNFGPGVGSGGGVSRIFQTPAFQTDIVPAGLSILNGRGVPDIALEGDPVTGVSVLLDGSQPSVTGGTSVAAPESAAMWALVLQACAKTAACATASGQHSYRLGNPNPLFYAIYRGAPAGSFTSKLGYHDVFYDLLYGRNDGVGASSGQHVVAEIPGYTAGPGYDLVTGIGAPFAGHLIWAITGQQVH